MLGSQAVLCADSESIASLLPTFVVLVANSFSETMAGNVAVDNTQNKEHSNLSRHFLTKTIFHNTAILRTLKAPSKTHCFKRLNADSAWGRKGRISFLS